MTTEQQLQEAVQSQLQSLTVFTEPYVVINDYGLLDETSNVTNIAIVENSANPSSLHASGDRDFGTITIPVTIAVRFMDWKPTLDDFRDMRQDVFDLFSDTTGARGLSLAGVSVDTVTPGGAVNYLGLDNNSQLPIWVTQQININVTLF